MEKKLITAQHPTRAYTCHIPAEDQPWTLNRDWAGMIFDLFLGHTSQIAEGPFLKPFSYVKQSWDFFTF
jgi:hypothetical protein